MDMHHVTEATKIAHYVLERTIYNTGAYLRGDILPDPREDVRRPMAKYLAHVGRQFLASSRCASSRSMPTQFWQGTADFADVSGVKAAARGAGAGKT